MRFANTLYVPVKPIGMASVANAFKRSNDNDLGHDNGLEFERSTSLIHLVKFLVQKLSFIALLNSLCYLSLSLSLSPPTYLPTYTLLFSLPLTITLSLYLSSYHNPISLEIPIPFVSFPIVLAIFGQIYSYCLAFRVCFELRYDEGKN